MGEEAQFESSSERIANLTQACGRFACKAIIGTGALAAGYGAVEYLSGLNHNFGEGLLKAGSIYMGVGYLALQFFNKITHYNPGQQGPNNIE